MVGNVLSSALRTGCVTNLVLSCVGFVREGRELLVSVAFRSKEERSHRDYL